MRVTGTVQGVGFRPFVHRLAGELELAGWVLNDGRGVLIEAEGAAPGIERLIAALQEQAPPLAQVEQVTAEAREPRGESGFRIAASHGGETATPVPPEAATCEACLAEIGDPRDRRYRYPFANCTDCGPRLTIVRGVPYDRPLTTMAGFEMCERCRAEYEDPGDRRFHAEPIACPECGPRAVLLDASGREIRQSLMRDAVSLAAEALLDGAVVAVKGLGGYHLACRADRENAVAALRSRKRREERPFALMVADAGAARRLAALGPLEEELLASRQRPIVLAPRRGDAGVAPSVAPRSDRLGLILPYTPLHHLLLADCGGTPLVMTSGNLAEEPIAFRDGDALAQLGGIADLLLAHDRPIETRVDDSVVQVTGGRPQLLRRSRGHVPEPLPLPGGAGAPPLLACGAELKNAFCLAKDGRAWVGHHIGDLKGYETLSSFRAGVEHFERLFDIAPVACAHDLHPDHLSTRYALERSDAEPLAVQHHHAHLAACLAEHSVEGPAVGAILDGAGLGTDGTVWGGEVLLGDLRDFERACWLLPVPMPGGDAAAREPWRMACAWLAAARRQDDPAPPEPLARQVAGREWRNACRLAGDPGLSPPTSSAGRLFDAVAALCGVRARNGYEAQAAIELEAIADREESGAYPVGRDGAALDPREAVERVVAEIAAGVPPARISARFHNGLADAFADACLRAAAANGLSTVVLSGGVFQNRLLLERCAGRVEAGGADALTPRRLPPNDGGIAYGQAAVAATRLATGWAAARRVSAGRTSPAAQSSSRHRSRR